MQNKKTLYGTIIVVLLAFLAWQGRGYIYLWRMQAAGFVPRGLVRMGEKATPLLLGACEKLDTLSDPEWCESLAFALKEIRYLANTRRTGSVSRTQNSTLLLPVDTTLARAFRRTFAYCKDTESRLAIISSLSDLDYRMKARFFCDAFPLASTMEKSLLTVYPESLLWLVYREHPTDGAYFGWQRLDANGIARQQAAMQRTLEQCLLPILERSVAEIRDLPYEAKEDWAIRLEDIYLQFLEE